MPTLPTLEALSAHPGFSLATGPLTGLKVLELGQLIAGPFAAKTLGDFGADVVKIEPPGAGDPLRQWRLMKDGIFG
jgi:formyl-CoA transferase